MEKVRRAILGAAITGLTAFDAGPTTAAEIRYVHGGVTKTYDSNVTCSERYRLCLLRAPNSRASCERGYQIARRTGRYPAPAIGPDFGFECRN
jgi:hypothetical protein